MNSLKKDAGGNGQPLHFDSDTKDQLLTLAASDREVFFETLVARYRTKVIAQAFRITGNYEDAEDVAQLTFMKAFINLPRFRWECSFSTWLIRIAINEARMWLRKHARHRSSTIVALAPDEEHAQALDLPDDRPNPESLCCSDQRDALVAEAIGRLRPGSRAVLELCDIEGHSTLHTAKLLGITVNAVKSRRNRGRGEMRRKLAYRLFRQSAGIKR